MQQRKYANGVCLVSASPWSFSHVFDRTQIMKSSRSLSVTINHVLDLTKIEAGQLTLSSTDFNMRQVILTCYGFHLEYSCWFRPWNDEKAWNLIFVNWCTSVLGGWGRSWINLVKSFSQRTGNFVLRPSWLRRMCPWWLRPPPSNPAESAFKCY